MRATQGEVMAPREAPWQAPPWRDEERRGVEIEMMMVAAGREAGLDGWTDLAESPPKFRGPFPIEPDAGLYPDAIPIERDEIYA